MATCANCKADAAYRVKNGYDQAFCAKHLPLFVNLRKHLGSVVEEISADVKEDVKKVLPKKKKEDSVVEAPVVEDAVVEAPVVEEPVEQAE